MEMQFVTREKFDEMVQQYADAAKSQDWGPVNVYRCPSCGWFVISIDTDRGVTPAFKICENPEHENAAIRPAIGFAMASAFYRPGPTVREVNASHEWFRPSYEIYLTIKHQPTADFVAEGGLLFRKFGSDRVEGHDVIFGE